MHIVRDLMYRLLPVVAVVAMACMNDEAANEMSPAAVPTSSPVPALVATPTTAMVSEPAVELFDCEATPRQTEGPYYADVGGFRQDVTEGLPGAPLTVQLRVVEVGTCAAIPDVVVDLWHTDAAGRYSAFEDAIGETFMRGKQITDADGIVEFTTIYPGWYPGRTVHAHFKVTDADSAVVASQMYFPQDVTDSVFQSDPYAARGEPDTTNATDGVARGIAADHPLMGTVVEDGDGYAATLVVGVRW